MPAVLVRSSESVDKFWNDSNSIASSQSLRTVMAKSRILLVEDNPHDRVLTLRALEEENPAYCVDTVEDGIEAMDYLLATGAHSNRAGEALPRLVLLDIKLPKMDGLEVLERIRANEITRLLPVVVLTSSAQQKDLIESYRLGINSYIQKPVSYDEFIKTAKQLGTYWLGLNKTPR
jgi:two-component system response regulator